MARLGIFETQRKSVWFQQMKAVADNNFGYSELSWRRRALLAIPEAGIEGQALTTLEMEDALIPFIGPAMDRPSRAAMVNIGMANGIIEKTDRKHRPARSASALTVYNIVGHMEMVDNNPVPVMMGEVA